MKIVNVLFVSHEEAKHICDKKQYQEASLLDLLKLNLRMIHCRLTRSYSRRNNMLTKVLRNPAVVSLTNDEKQHFQNRITQHLNK